MAEVEIGRSRIDLHNTQTHILQIFARVFSSFLFSNFSFFVCFFNVFSLLFFFSFFFLSFFFLFFQEVEIRQNEMHMSQTVGADGWVGFYTHSFGFGHTPKMSTATEKSQNVLNPKPQNLNRKLEAEAETVLKWNPIL